LHNYMYVIRNKSGSQQSRTMPLRLAR